ncbi:hypothetical protein E1A91_D08G137900v1 [Gossypium mustelinum]|uniref:Uncharacterized protein n=1 Tax=Gossypium mustelinum TaxID=34275 RepID=A0A5D2TXX9_GOSMU|nr:hypothetical protein E1A91_D08G137900v1 [Gossypium mustelinum]
MIVVPTIDSDSDEKMIDSGADAKREKIWMEFIQEDGVYTNQPAHSGRRVNLVKASNLNGHIGSSLLEDGVYTAKPVYLECRVNSLQEKTTQRSCWK